MKKTTAIFAGCAVLILGLFLVFGNSSDQDTPTSEPAQPPADLNLQRFCGR